MTPDAVNATFELGGALLTTLSIRALWRDKILRGVHWGPTFFFTVWGFWNLIFYSAIAQPLSFLAGIALVLVNLTWLVSLLHFSRRRAA